MSLADLLRLAETAFSGHSGPQLPEELLRSVVEESRSRAGVLRQDGDVRASWPRNLSAPAEGVTEGWTEIPFGGDWGRWCLRLLQPERLEETLVGATHLALRAFALREELKRSRFDERFHLWELEAVRSMATSIGGILERSRLAEELIAHLVALLGVRSAQLYLGSGPGDAKLVGSFGPPVLDPSELTQAWSTGLYREDVHVLPLTTSTGTLGLLVAAHKEARSGTEPFAASDARLLELFAIQVTVALEYARLTRESLERELLKQELEVAAAIQSHLYPRSFPEFPGYRIAASSSPSRQVAGDTYDVLVQDGSLVATVTDVSGKGAGAGMIASGVHAGVHLLLQEALPLPELAGRINRYLVGSTADNRFATFVVARVGPDGSLTVVNAGHCPVLIRRANGEVDQIGSSAVPLGIFGNAYFPEQHSRLAAGDLLFLFTDGLTEAENPEGDELGVDKVAEVVAGLAGRTAEEACGELLRAVDSHACGQPLQDDATLLVLERLAE